jgi:hypothetical protein
MMAFDSSVGASILKDRWGLASLLASVEFRKPRTYTWSTNDVEVFA